jgi:hypothetical protein
VPGTAVSLHHPSLSLSVRLVIKTAVNQSATDPSTALFSPLPVGSAHKPPIILDNSEPRRCRDSNLACGPVFEGYYGYGSDAGVGVAVGGGTVTITGVGDAVGSVVLVAVGGTAVGDGVTVAVASGGGVAVAVASDGGVTVAVASGGGVAVAVISAGVTVAVASGGGVTVADTTSGGVTVVVTGLVGVRTGVSVASASLVGGV